MAQNMVSTHLSNEQWAAVDAALDQLDAALQPLLVALAPDQRKRVVRMGDGSEAFVRKALDVVTQNVGLMPRNFAGLPVPQERRHGRGRGCVEVAAGRALHGPGAAQRRGTRGGVRPRGSQQGKAPRSRGFFFHAARIRNSVALATGCTWRALRRSSTRP